VAYARFRLGGGMQNKSAADSIPDDALAFARMCSFDLANAVQSARGRDKLNSDAAVAGSGSILGHFDGQVSSTKRRYAKRGADVYEDFTTDLGAPAAEWPGKTATDFSATGYLTGFAYSDYVYLADGTTIARWNRAQSRMETWGLTSPGYMELTNATPLAVTSGSPTVTVTTPYPLHSGMSSTENIELVGMEPLGGVVGEDINKLHFDSSGFTNADVAVTGTDATDFTITFQRFLAATYFTKIEIDKSNLTGTVTATWSRLVPGSNNPPANESQRYVISGASGGTFRLKHDGEWTADIAYNASLTTIRDALIALPNISASSSGASTVATITGASTFTFAATANATSSASGGGSIGFMRQGPKCAITTSGGGLEGGRYFYAYAYFNGVAESNFSAQVPVEIVTRNSYVTLSEILPGPVGTTERRIYRTDVNQRSLYFIGKIGDNTTTTFIDLNKLPLGADPYALIGDEIVDQEFQDSVISRLSGKKAAEKRALIDAAENERRRQRTATNLGLQANWTDHDPPPLGLQEVGILNETAFGIAAGEVRFSEAGNPEHWPLGNRLKPGRDTSEAALTWRAYDRDCIIYTESGLYRLSQIGLDFTESRFEEIESPVGLAGRRAVAQLDGQLGHVFLAKTGLYLFDGARVTEISYAIESLFTDSSNIDYINPSYMSTAIAVTSRDRLYLSYGSSAANDRLLIVDFQDIQNPKFSVNTWSHTALFRERADGTLIAGDASGYVWQLDTGWTDNGSSIYWVWTSKHYSLNGGMAFMLDEVFLDADLAGSTTILTIAMQQRDTQKAVQFTLSTTGRQRIRCKVPTYMKGERVLVGMASSGAVKRTAYALEFTYLPMGEP
jgi:hypothetical protein